MRVTRLEIKLQESYEPEAGQFRGIVTLTGDEGQQSLVLSPGTLGRIFAVIKEDAVEKAKAQAKQAGNAIQHAADGVGLALTAEVDF